MSMHDISIIELERIVHYLYRAHKDTQAHYYNEIGECPSYISSYV